MGREIFDGRGWNPIGAGENKGGIGYSAKVGIARKGSGSEKEDNG